MTDPLVVPPAPEPPAPEAPLAAKEPAIVAPGRQWWRGLLLLVFLAALYTPPYFFEPNYKLPQFNRYMALALFALSVDLIWGYAGLLSLGQGLYFGLGAYVVGWSLILQNAALANDLPRYAFGPDMALPDFMFQCRLPRVPIWIAPLINIWLALALAIVLPGLLSVAFGWIVFRRRIKGVFFSLITQALLLAVFYLVSNQRPYTGGVDGMPGLASLEVLGYTFDTAVPTFYLIAAALTLCFLACLALVWSKFGKVLTAIRDNENRIMALGYNTAMYKTFAFGLSGCMAGLAGALFAANNGSAGPQFFSIADSIEVVIFVAVGGRGTLVGAILGALLVNWTKDYFNRPELNKYWPIVLGSLFIVVVAFVPDGIVGGCSRLIARLKRLRSAPA